MTTQGPESPEESSLGGADWRDAAQSLYIRMVERLLSRRLSSAERELAVRAHRDCESPRSTALRLPKSSAR